MVEPKPAHRPVPARALVLSLASLTVPVLWALAFPQWAGDEVGMLVWLTALVPAFLLTYYRGWKGASLALAAGMAVLSSTQVFLLLAGISTPNWHLVLVVVLLYIVLCVGIGILAELLHRERWSVERMALTDPLTGLPNRRHASIFLEASFASAERGTDLAVIIFDVDNFKTFNDRFGHQAGDEVLQRLGAIFLEQTRTMDVTARWGGEEFISVLPHSDEAGAVAFADRVREALSSTTMPGKDGITVSAGVAAHVPGMETPELLVAAADRALYQAKNEGRDQIRVAEEARSARPGPAAAVAGAAEEEGEAGEDPPAHKRRDQVRILVVSEDEAMRRDLTRTLRFHGYDVLDAPTGEDALNLLERSRHGADLIMTDIILPGMSGFALVDRIARKQPELRVLYLSGYSLREVSWEGVPGTRTDFVQKPLAVEELGTRVREMLDEPAGVAYRR